MRALVSLFGCLLLLTPIEMVSAKTVTYDLEKPKRKKKDDPPAFTTFVPDDKFAVFKADWTYSLSGVAAQRRLGNFVTDTVLPKAVTAPLAGVGNGTVPKNKVEVTWANGTMFAGAEFSPAQNLLGELTGGYNARVMVNGSATTKITGATMNGDWAAAAAGSTSKLVVSGKAKGGGKWDVVPNGILQLGGCIGGGFPNLKPQVAADLNAALAGVKAACAVKDPITFEAVNEITGETAAGTLVAWELEGFSNQGSMGLTDGDLLIDTLSGRFFLEIPGLYTAEQGMIDFAFENGIVTRSSTNGIFAGLLPAVGAAATGSHALGPFSLNYDFGWGDTPYDVRFDVASEGSAVVFQAVPEPATWAMWLVGFAAIGVALRAAPARRNVQRR